MGPLAASDRLPAVADQQSTAPERTSNKRKQAPSSTVSPASPAPRRSLVLEAVRDRLEDELRMAQSNSPELDACYHVPESPSNNNDDEEEDPELRAHDERQAALLAEEEAYYDSDSAYEDYLCWENAPTSVE